jgi:hypothetical protein
MSRKSDAEIVEIQQVENGYLVFVGASCHHRERMVFQSFCELVNFLNTNFTHREEVLFVDYNQQSTITLKN